MSDVIININGQDDASKELDQVITKMEHLNQEGQQTQQQMGSMTTTSNDASSGLTSMGKSAGLAAVAFVAFETAKKVLVAVKDTVVELNAELGNFQLELARMETLVNNFSDSSLEADQSLDKMAVQIEEMAERSGEPLSNLNRLMTELTLRLGDAELASDNFERAMDIMAFTGEDASKVAKDLSEAQQGTFTGMAEGGILTLKQAEAFSEMEDQTQAASDAMAVIDENIGNFVDEMPDAVKASNSLSQSWERLKTSAAQMLGVDSAMSAAASTLESLAETSEMWTSSFTLGINNIKTELEDMASFSRDVGDEQRDFVLSEGEAARRRQIDRINVEYDRQIDALKAVQREQGNIVNIQGSLRNLSTEIALLEERKADALETIDLTYRRQRVALEEQNEADLESLTLRRQALEAEDERERISLESQARQAEIIRERDLAMNELIDDQGQITDQTQAQIIEEEMLIAILESEEKRMQALAALRKDGSEAQEDQRQELEQVQGLRADALLTEDQRLQALITYEARRLEIGVEGLEGQERRLALIQAEQQLQSRMADIGDQEATAITDETNALIEDNNALLSDANDLLDDLHEPREGGLSADDIIGQDRQRDLEELLSQIRAVEQGFRSLRNTFSEGARLMRGLGEEEISSNREIINSLEQRRQMQQELGQDTEGIDNHINSLRAENEELRQNHRLMQQRMEALGSTSDSLAQMSFAIGSLADQQWDFQEASSSVVQAQQALSSAVSSALDAAGMGIKEKAKWMAVFEGAQATAATAMALMFPSPSYWSAAANHAIAATQFGLIAGGVIGGGQATGAGGQAQGATASSTVQRDSIMDEAMRFQENQDQNQGSERDVTVIIEMGSNNMYLEESETVGRRLVSASETELIDLFERRLNV